MGGSGLGSGHGVIGLHTIGPSEFRCNEYKEGLSIATTRAGAIPPDLINSSVVIILNIAGNCA